MHYAAFVNQTIIHKFVEYHCNKISVACRLYFKSLKLYPFEARSIVGDTLQFTTILHPKQNSDLGYSQIFVQEHCLKGNRFTHRQPNAAEYHRKGLVKYINYNSQFDTTYYPFEFYYEVVNDLCP